MKFTLFWYHDEFILLKGKKDGSFINYKGFLPACNTIGNSSEPEKGFKRATELLEFGNEIKDEKKRFIVFNKDNKVGEINKKYPWEAILF